MSSCPDCPAWNVPPRDLDVGLEGRPRQARLDVQRVHDAGRDVGMFGDVGPPSGRDRDVRAIGHAARSGRAARPNPGGSSGARKRTRKGSWTSRSWARAFGFPLGTVGSGNVAARSWGLGGGPYRSRPRFGKSRFGRHLARPVRASGSSYPGPFGARRRRPPGLGGEDQRGHGGRLLERHADHARRVEHARAREVHELPWEASNPVAARAARTARRRARGSAPALARSSARVRERSGDDPRPTSRRLRAAPSGRRPRAQERDAPAGHDALGRAPRAAR